MMNNFNIRNIRKVNNPNTHNKKLIKTDYSLLPETPLLNVSKDALQHILDILLFIPKKHKEITKEFLNLRLINKDFANYVDNILAQVIPTSFMFDNSTKIYTNLSNTIYFLSNSMICP